MRGDGWHNGVTIAHRFLQKLLNHFCSCIMSPKALRVTRVSLTTV